MNDKNGSFLDGDYNDAKNDNKVILQRVSYRLYVKERLKHRSDIDSFFTRRDNVIRLSGLFYTMLSRKNDFGYSRFAVTVKRNKAKAVFRNKAKRIVREIFRTEKIDIPIGYDYFIFVNKPYGYSFQDYKKDLIGLFQRF